MSSTMVLTPTEFAVIPYFHERSNLPANILSLIYRKLCAQGIDRDLLHNGGMLEEEFVEFAANQALTSIFLDLNGAYAGLAWLTNCEQTETINKALGAFAFFREYWHPNKTDVFAKICLGQWFNVMDFTMIYGITPAPNRAARAFCRRNGFEYSARIPGFVTYRGKTVDAMVATLTRERFNQGA